MKHAFGTVLLSLANAIERTEHAWRHMRLRARAVRLYVGFYSAPKRTPSR